MPTRVCVSHVSIAVLLTTIIGVYSHGSIVGLNGDVSGATGSRSYQTFKGMHPGLSEFDWFSLLGVGGRIDEYDSAGGEPGQTQHGPQYAGLKTDPSGKSWDISAQCKAGDVINFRVAITANHGGINEMRYLCADNINGNSIKTLDFYDKNAALTTARACYDKNPDSNVWRNNNCYEPRTLKRAPGSSGPTFHPDRPEMYILALGGQCFGPTKPSPRGSGLDMSYQLPGSLASCRRVIVQWWWQTTNSCMSPTWRKWKAAGSWPCPDTAWPRWDFATCDASKGTKAGSGEQFAALVDIPLSDTVSCDASTGAPPAGGGSTGGGGSPGGSGCTGNPCPVATMCRSEYGYCGTSANHCNAKSTWRASSCGSSAPTGGSTGGAARCPGVPCTNTAYCRSQYGHCGASAAYCNAQSTWRANGCGSLMVQQLEDEWSERSVPPL